MPSLLGAFTALSLALLTFLIVGVAAHNLPETAAAPVSFSALGVAALCGFLWGSALYRRARRSRDHLGLFGGLAGMVSGGIVGAVVSVLLLAAYQATYGTWPQDGVDRALVALSYPIFGALGFCAGAAIGLILGLLAGSTLRILTRSR